MNDLVPLGVLVPLWRDQPTTPPAATPLGAAALAIPGARVIFGGRAEGGLLLGHEATPEGWRPGALPVAAVWDRFPSQSQPQAYADLLAALPDALVGSPPALMALCRDKIATQRALEAGGIELPELVDDPTRFADALARWPDGGFAKPVHGSLGRGVLRVGAGDPVPARGEGAVPGQLDALLLQRAVRPPRGWAGVSVRALVQREAGAWVLAPAVARRSVDEPVVNVAKGAEVAPALDVLDARTNQEIARLSLAIAAILGEDPLVLELGVDLVVDEDGRPWPIEVNGRPRGHLEAVAKRWPDRFAAAHVEACARPLRALLHVAQWPR